jgi:Tol biopolymer transport system component/DNA-binding winged helix-turn-helix (wHTH) protein
MLHLGVSANTAVAGPDYPIRFGLFEVDLRAGELRKQGVKIKLQDQPLRILVTLLQQSGKVVTREELYREVWPADTFVDFEHSLNAAIKKLRDALGDDPENPRFIETIPRRGYRFLADVSLPELAKPRSRFAKRLALFCIPVAAVILLMFMYYVVRSPVSAEPMTVVPLTTSPGAETQAAFSSDGEQVAFTWDGNSATGTDIYVKRVGTEDSLRLTQGFGFVCCAAWTSDNRYIAFAACSSERQGIFLVPSLGGLPRKIWNRGCGDLGASPTEPLVAFGDKSSPDSPFALFTMSIVDLLPHELTFPEDKIVGDQNPVFSPDGKSVAFIRIVAEGNFDLFTIPLTGGSPRQLTFDRTAIFGLTWTADAREIIFSSHRGGGQSLWVVPVGGGEPSRLPVGGASARGPAVSRKGNRLAYTQGDIHPNLWVLDLSGNPAKSSGPPRPFVSSSAYNNAPRFSPDGRKLAFASHRSGDMEIWTCDAANCSNPQQLTFLRSVSGTPRWSPDGLRVVFESRPAGHSQLFVANAAGGKPVALTDGTAEDKVASWSSDGRLIYFSSNRHGKSQIWKIAASGGSASQVTSRGGFAAFESPDGKFLYYVKDDYAGVWRMPLAGGEEVRILPLPTAEHWGDWALCSRGIYFVDESRPRQTINFYAFANQKVSQVAQVDGLPPPGDPGFAVSPDEKRIVFSQVDRSAVDIMLVENFR